MRINAHIASAILPTDKMQWGANNFYMKKTSVNLDVIKSQKEEILAIRIANSTTFTAIAKKAGVVPSTINRFMAEETPSNALSAVTMRKVRDAWIKRYAPTPEENLSDKDYSFIAAIQIVIEVFGAKIGLEASQMENYLIHQMGGFQLENRSGGVLVFQELIKALRLKQHKENPGTYKKFPPHAPAQS